VLINPTGQYACLVLSTALSPWFFLPRYFWCCSVLLLLVVPDSDLLSFARLCLCDLLATFMMFSLLCHHSEMTAADDVSAAEQQLYLQFFKHLGISDDQKTGFLASLLRNVFDACSKLDMHLAPYGATVHSAVSRMLVPDNPRDAPSYRWIRIADRVGFFSDADAHAVRVVNIGLSYAYRFLEADAISAANAALLEETQQPIPRLAAVTGKADRVPTGGVVVGASVNRPPPAGATPLACAEKALPPGGAVVSVGGIAVGGGDAAGLPASELRSKVAGRSELASTGDGATPPGGLPNERPLPNGGAVVSGTTGASAGAAGDTLGDPLAGLDEEDYASDPDGGAPSHVVYERQPHVVPSTTAVDAVAAVLRIVGQRDDAAGKDVLRKLLIDSLLCLVRTEPGSNVATGAAGVTSGSHRDWLAVNKHLGRWWPSWRAPDNQGSMVPPSGTVASVVNRGRAAKSSRWVLMLNMAEIKKSVEKLSVRPSRFFPKMELPDEEPVVRVHYRKPLRLTLVVASMLLLCTKEERFPAILARLAAAGRSALQKGSNLSSAARHEFFSTGLRASTAAVAGSARTGSASTNGTTRADTPEQTGASLSDKRPDMEMRMSQMTVTLAAEEVQESAINRSKRLDIIRAKSAARSATAARPPPSSSGPRSSGAPTPALVPPSLAPPSASAPPADPLPPVLHRVAARPVPGAVVIHGPTAASRRADVAGSSQADQPDLAVAASRGTKRHRSSGPPALRAASPTAASDPASQLDGRPPTPSAVPTAAVHPVGGASPGSAVPCGDALASRSPLLPPPRRHGPPESAGLPAATSHVDAHGGGAAVLSSGALPVPAAPSPSCPPAASTRTPAPAAPPRAHVAPAAVTPGRFANGVPGAAVVGYQAPFSGVGVASSDAAAGASVASSANRDQGRAPQLESTHGALPAAPVSMEGTLGECGVPPTSSEAAAFAPSTQLGHPTQTSTPSLSQEDDMPFSALYPRASAFPQQREVHDKGTQAAMMDGQLSLSAILGRFEGTPARGSNEK